MREGLRTSIRLKLAVLVAGAVVLTAGALSVVSYSYVHQTLRREIHARLTVVASDRQRMLLGYIEQQQERVALVASRTRLRQLLGELAAGTTDMERFRGESRQILRDAQRIGAGVKAIWIADPAGRVVTATDDSYLGHDISSEPQFLEGRTGPQVNLRHEESGTDVALLSAPAVVQPGDRLVGVVMMLTDAHDILDAVSDPTELGQSGSVLVGMRVNGTIRYLLMSESGTSTSEVPASNAPAMVAATSGERGFKQTRDWRGVDVLAAYQPAGYRNWGIVTKIDTAEAYAPIAWLRRLFVTIGGVALLWGALIAYLLARRFTRPILRMASMADSIATGGLRARVDVESQDEIGKLGEAFNVMSEELAHSYAILEERVNQRTGELQAERDLLQGLLDNIPDFIYFKDAESRYVRVNKAKARKCGLREPAEAIGKTDFDFFPREQAQKKFEDEQRIIQTGQPIIGLEEQEPWPDGHITWMSSTKIPWRDTTGKVIGTFGISRDITGRKRAEEELNGYFTLSLDLFCIADYRGYFKRLNPAWERVLGYTLKQLTTQPFISFVHPEDRAATVREFDRLLKGAHTVQFENRYRCKDGSHRWLQWNAIAMPEEQLIHAAARDVSEHKRAQELLARFANALNKKNQEIQEDLKIAREVHQVFVSQGCPVFPRTATAETSALRFNHRYLPTSALGGDFFEILQLADTEAGIFICDVMGHGMRAALVTSIIRGLIDKYRDQAHEPDRLLAQINTALITNLKTVSTTIFATACYVIVDAATGQMRYASAGHPSPFLLRRTAGTVERLEDQVLSHAPALGLIPDAIYPVSTHTLAVHDSVLLFTDGLYEVQGDDGQQFGFDELQEAVHRRISLPGGELLEQLLVLTRRHAVDGEFTDDVCLVEVQLAAKMTG